MKNAPNKNSTLRNLIQISLFLESDEKEYFLKKLESYTENQIDAFLDLFSQAEKKQNDIIENILEDNPHYFDEILKNAHTQERKQQEQSENEKEEAILQRLEQQLFKAEE